MRRLYALFFVSGATGLVYETVWGRELHLIFGTSQFAIATVLAAFMAGLAIGGALGARWAPTVDRPLRVYAALELTIGVFALAFPTVVSLLEPAYRAMYVAWAPGPVLFGVYQFLLLGSALLIPTACMGATLPILTRFVAPAPGSSGKAVGTLYAVNTAGAVFGVWLVGFVLLPGYGVHATTLGAASANIALALFAFYLDRRGRTATELAVADGQVYLETLPPRPHRLVPLPRALLCVAALAGFSSLALEVSWFRLLTLVLGASVYAFSAMLLAFLIGIAAGGHVGGTLADRWGVNAIRGVIGAQLFVAAVTWGSTFLWPYLPLTFVKLYFIVEPMPELLWPMKTVVAMLLMLPGAFGMGATFPLLTRAATANDLDVDVTRPVGAVYAANTVGSLFGAFLAGFILLPAIRVSGTALLCVGVNLAAATVAAWSSGWRPRRISAGVAAALVLIYLVRAPWDPMMMTSGVYKYVDNLKEPTMAELERRMIDRYHLLWYNEGLSSVVTVARNMVTGNIWLANNGKIDASTTTDMPTQVLVAHTPMMFTAKDADNVLLIGLASGITLGALTLHPELAHIDVAELEPSMPHAAQFFAAYNHEALLDPRVRILPNDGRNQLLLTPPGTYDVIVAEPSNPWLTGVSNLFTREFFEMGKSRLAPGGVWSQWVQMYGMDSRDLRSVIRTFADTYAYVLVYSTIRDADLVMVGSDRPIVMTAELADQLVHKNVGLEAEMMLVNVNDGYDLLSHFLFDREVAMAMTEGVPLNTDDNMLVEYSAPRNLHRETSAENFVMLLPHALTPLNSVRDSDGLIRLAKAYAWRDDLVRALIALKEAEARDPDRADVLDLYNRYQRRLNDRIK